MCINGSEEYNTRENIEGIPEFYAGKNIFVTGGSGFIGKSLVEKLIRSCPDIGTIYVLLRPKRGKQLVERLKQIIDEPLFERVRKEQPNLKLENKIIPLEGDMLEIDLGLSSEDRQTIVENVHIFFHAAATVRFDEPLKSSVLLNVRGTREVSQIVLESKKAEAYIHVSTAFANCDRSIAAEVLYPAKADWRKTIDVAERFDNDILSILTTKYIDAMPNTYCFTKNLAEHVVHDMCKGKIPTAIIRPSIVVGTLREEPVLGWIDNFNGPCAILIAYGKGIMRTVYAHDHYKPDYIPVDVLTKSLVVSAWDLAQRKVTTEPEILQCTSYSAEWLRPTNAKLANSAKVFYDVPLNDILWKPATHTSNSIFLCYIRTILFMIIPSILLDGLLKITGKQPRLLKIQKKIFIAQLALRHFMNNEWVYPNDNLLKLQKTIHPKDKADWDYEFMNYDYESFTRQTVLGIRRYLLKEPDHTLPQAKRHYKIMSYVDVISKFIMFSILITIIWKFQFIQNIMNLVV